MDDITILDVDDDGAAGSGSGDAVFANGKNDRDNVIDVDADDADDLEMGGDGSGSGSGGQGGGSGSGDRVKGPWSPEEDAILSKLVSNFGARNWSLIARGISGRSGKSCRLRWCNQLDPCVKRKPFTGKIIFPFCSIKNPFISCS